jgi:hypothetical protein
MSKKKTEVAEEIIHPIGVIVTEGEVRFFIQDQYYSLAIQQLRSLMALATGEPKEEPEIPLAYDNLEGYVRASRLLKKGLTSTEAAGVMCVSDEVFRRINSKGNSLIKGDSARGEMSRQDEEYGDTVKSIGKGDPRFPNVPEAGDKVFINLRQVKAFQREGLPAAEIAQRLELDKEGFLDWLEKNAKLLEGLK